jgi:hypothetical protein
VRVRVQVATLGIEVTNADSRAKGDIGGNVLHGLGVQSCLELRRHESVTFSRVDQAHEVNSEHGKVEPKRDNNKTEDSGEEMLEPQALHQKLALIVNPSRFRIRTGVTVLESPSSTHNWRAVRDPTHAIVKRPTHLTLRVAPSERPVNTSQNHHGPPNAWVGPNSCWLVKQLNDRAVRAVKKINGESSKIRRD